jgi:hyperosmotically inducible periplasmic protein
MRFAALVLAVALAATAAPVAQSVGHKQTMFEIEHELLRLPTYGVFDFLAFGVEKGQVTLSGYAYSGLKSQAERAVKRVPGVDSVDNRIENLPASQHDDQIRWATFYRIYTDSFLSRYSPGGPMAARYELLQSRRFPGLQPFGTYPIHIIVKNRQVTLVGVVNNESDKTLAGFRAREVPSVAGVTNELMIGK